MPKASHAFLSCRAFAVASDPGFRVWAGQRPPARGGFAVTGVGLGAGVAGAGVCTQRGPVRRGRRRVRGSRSRRAGAMSTKPWNYSLHEPRSCARRYVKPAKRVLPYVIVDGTVIATDRIAADRPFYSGKHRHHGVNLQVIATPDGDILWISRDLPGSPHGTTAARIWQVLPALARAGLIALADKGYQGLDETGDQKAANRAHVQHCAPANAPTRNSKPGASSANYADSPTALDASPKLSTPSQPRTRSHSRMKKAQYQDGHRNGSPVGSSPGYSLRRPRRAPPCAGGTAGGLWR